MSLIHENKEPLNLLNLSTKDMLAFVAHCGEQAFRGQQLIRWIHQHGMTDFEQMTNLSKSFRQRLQAEAIVQPLQVLTEQQASDGTRKWLFRVSGGSAIETVFIPESNRGTLCISSQVGCALNCSFCATGKEGFNRNLNVAEIIGQLWHAVKELTAHQNQKQHVVTNVVMMGMGEPLLNYENVIAALDLMMSDHGYNLSKYRVTVSTSGVIPAMLRLREESPAALAVSLHAPNDALRNQLVPLNKKYPLAQLMAVCRDYFAKEPKRKVTFEYVMLKDVNDSLDHAKQLIRLLEKVPCKMNLIPFNPFPRTHYERSSGATIEVFQQRLIKAGIPTWIRKTRGDDIDGACGQLAGKVQDRTGRHLRWQQTGRLIPTREA